MALVSPGVEVKVIDESFYTPAAAGTVPVIFVASASNKTSSSGSGIAPGTTKANAGRAYLITSQRELGETFGDPIFKSDNNGNMIHAGEQNEYGLQAAYSILGVTNQAYVVRADIDLGELDPSATAPDGAPANGAYWFDTQVSNFGILEWNAAALTTTGGQTFTAQLRTVVVETSDIDSVTDAPKTSIGQIGTYAIDATTTQNRMWYKTAGTNTLAGSSGTWVEVGSDAWKASHYTVRGSNASPTITIGDSIIINGTTVVATGVSATTLASDINGAGIAGVAAAVVDSALEIYGTSLSESDGATADGKIKIEGGVGTLTGPSNTPSDAGVLGIAENTYSTPKLAIQPHTNVPTFKSTDAEPAPTGSVWIKTTTPNGGADFSIKQYNSDTQLWGTVTSPMYLTAQAAIYDLDKTGGTALRAGDVFVKSNVEEEDLTIADFKIFVRNSTGATSAKSAKITTQLAAGTYGFDMQETVANSNSLSTAKTISVTTVGASSDADTVAGEINAAGFTNIVAYVDSTNKLVIEHKLGGEIRIDDADGLIALAGYTAFNYTTEEGTANFYSTPDGDSTNDYVISLWKELDYTASPDAPASLAEDGKIWYSSVVDEVDLMIHDGTNWVGYQNFSSDYADTNAEGPLVSATEPTEQTDGTALVDGDVWIDTSVIEDYPGVYIYNAVLASWVEKDITDQTTDNGVLFADARWSDAGSNSAAATIEDLLTSDYLDPDAPDPALYPKGMLLWNMRRSGFNVKKFVRNYVDKAEDNTRFQVIGASGSLEDESMALYYPHRWVTASGNNEDGSGTFGRHAVRKTVVQSLQSEVNSNTDIRDEESRQFNLIATPGYPELIGEMVSLNYDRRLTAFVVGDTPFRLTPDATSLNEWATNVAGAVEDNDDGAVSRDEYLGMYYPAGFTSDNLGNNVVVPASHMALRTIILNDQVAYPWFAPAGTRRGGVTNATSTGYVTAEGEFQTVSLNTGQRDTLYSNNINPITFINGAGLVVFGQKTRARNASALDRVNVARLTVYMRGQLELLARPYLFEPNDKITRDQVKAAADAMMLELVGLRAIYDFLTVCDESNNTPARIDRNELYLDVAIEPVKAIEFIYIPLRIKNTGEIAALG
jgi:hypothetical protein